MGSGVFIKHSVVNRIKLLVQVKHEPETDTFNHIPMSADKISSTVDQSIELLEFNHTLDLYTKERITWMTGINVTRRHDYMI